MAIATNVKIANFVTTAPFAGIPQNISNVCMLIIVQGAIVVKSVLAARIAWGVDGVAIASTVCTQQIVWDVQIVRIVVHIKIVMTA